ncbi:MAG: GvpL/GvpF family gas vesicle protein, partial [Acidobacteriaceae bacterium]
AKAVFIQVHRMFSPLEEDISCRRTDRGKMLLDIAHLIKHESVVRYQNKYSCASQAMRDCQIMLSGPWPPYHFIHGTRRIATQAAAHA